MSEEEELAVDNEYAVKKATLAAANKFVTRPIQRIDDDIVRLKKNNGGRPKKYSVKVMKNLINKYFAWCEKHDEVPSIKGMMIHLKMYKDQFYVYAGYPEYTNLMEHARMIISNWAENDVYTTKGLAAGKIAYMKNIHGWSEKIESQNFTETRVITVAEAKAKIEMLAPRILEALKNSTVLQQLTHRDTVVDAEVVPQVNRL